MNKRYWWVAGVLCLSLPVQSASLFNPAEVSDRELSELRGRYVLPDRIIHFGVTMSTFWQNSAGQGIGALVSLRVDGSAQPNLSVSYIDQSGNGLPALPGTGQVLGGNGLTQVQGVSQSVRSAGDLNDALNDLSITVSRGGDTPAVQGGAALEWSQPVFQRGWQHPGEQPRGRAPGGLASCRARSGLAADWRWQCAAASQHQQQFEQRAQPCCIERCPARPAVECRAEQLHLGTAACIEAHRLLTDLLCLPQQGSHSCISPDVIGYGD